LLLLPGAALARWIFLRRDQVRALLLAAPLVGPPLRWALALAYIRGFSLCLRTGMPVLQGLRLLEELDPALRPPSLVMQAALREGETLSEAFQRCAFFPPLISQLLAAGEETGKTSELLERAAELGEMLLDSELAAFGAALQPLVLLFVGGLVGFVLIGTLAPLLQLAQSI